MLLIEPCSGRGDGGGRCDGLDGIVDDDGEKASKDEPVKEVVKETLSTERFNNALIKIKSKEFTVEELKSKFHLTKEQEAQL